MKDKTMLVVGIIIGIILGFVGIFVIALVDFTPSYFTIPSSQQEIVDRCENLNIEKSAECVVDNINTFYIYKETNDSMLLTFDELKERGGDCRNWALLYENIGKELEFYSQKIVIKTSDSTNHGLTIWSNSKGWCYLQNNDYGCVQLE